MATKKGMLSDKAMMVNCIDYKALPVGFANSEYQGNMSNPFLQGIKTSKYQRAAPKPASADVVAVSNARFLAGNRANNARLILDQYQKEAKEWTPPPVNLAMITRGDKDSLDYIFGSAAPYVGPRPPSPPSSSGTQTAPPRPPSSSGTQTPYRPAGMSQDALSVSDRGRQQTLRRQQQAVNPNPSSSSGVSRGDLILTQTIGQRADPTINADRLMRAYGSYDSKRQKEIGAKLGDIAQRQGIRYDNYGVSSQVMKGRRIASQPPDQGAGVVDRTAMIGLLLAVLQQRNSNANLDEIFGVLTPANLQQAASSGAGPSSDAGPSSGAGTSTDLSAALTQQGDAMPASSRTQPEIQKK